MDSNTLGFCTSATPQERTKGGDAAPTVPTDGAITTKITWAAAARTATATIQCTLHPKVTSRSWAIGQTTGGLHLIHGGRASKKPYNRR
jgi:hypothetical protein